MTVQPIRLIPITDSALDATADSCCGGGACAVDDAPAISAEPTPAASTTREIFVDGMTCDHCVRAVTEELTAIDGIDGVAVDLVAGGSSPVRLRSSAPVSNAQIEAAIQEAGYRLS